MKCLSNNGVFCNQPGMKIDIFVKQIDLIGFSLYDNPMIKAIYTSWYWSMQHYLNYISWWAAKPKTITQLPSRRKVDLQYYPIATWRKLNVRKTFRRCPRRLLNFFCTFNLRPLSTRIIYLTYFKSLSYQHLPKYSIKTDNLK